jgi:carbamoyl-phosphate synthase small subunit
VAGGSVWGAWGEVVFNTSLTGYQEILTDPSYYGQLVVLSAPLIGNYGTNPNDDESARAWAAGLSVRAASPTVSNWRADRSLDDYLRDRGVVAITEVDTRAFIRHLRDHGSQNAALSSTQLEPEHVLALARDVTCAEPYHWAAGDGAGFETNGHAPAGRTYHVVAYDFGLKRNLVRRLAAQSCRVTMVPATAPAADVLALQPDGVFLSNGPGDPAAVSYGTRRCGGCWGGCRCLASAWGTNCWGHDLQAQVRPPRRQPAGAASRQRPGGDLQPQLRLRRARRQPAGGGGDHPHQSQRRLCRRPARSGLARLQRPVPFRSRPRPPSRPLLV